MVLEMELWFIDIVLFFLFFFFLGAYVDIRVLKFFMYTSCVGSTMQFEDRTKKAYEKKKATWAKIYEEETMNMQ